MKRLYVLLAILISSCNSAFAASPAALGYCTVQNSPSVSGDTTTGLCNDGTAGDVVIEASGAINIKSVPTASQTDWLQISGSATGNPGAATLTATGNDTNVNLSLVGKGTGTIVAGSNVTISTRNIVTDTTTGSDIGTSSTQKLGFFGATPIIQPTGDVLTALQNLGLGASLTISAADVPLINLGTSTAATNPQRASDALTGLFSSVAGQLSVGVNISGTGTNIADFNSGGVFINTGGIAIGTSSISGSAAMDIGGFGAPQNAGTGALLLQTNRNGIDGMEFRNASSGVSADNRFAAYANDNSAYLAFSVPSTANTQAAIFGLTRSSSTFLFDSGGTARALGIGTLGAASLVLGTNNAAALTISSAQAVSLANPLPVGSGGTGNTTGTISLGTSASSTNPQRSGDAKTGIFSATAATVSVGVNVAGTGTDVGDFASTGLNLPGAATSYQLNGNNAVWQDAVNFNLVLGNSTFPAHVSQTGGGLNGTLNTAIGQQALQVNTTGSRNVAISAGNGTFGGALGANTTGFNNIAIGLSALASNTTGSENVAVGAGACAFNLVGTSNICLGPDVESLSSAVGFIQVTAVGRGVLAGNSGNNNTGVGYEALNANTTGTNNVAMGLNAGLLNTTGSNNLILGTNVASTTLTTGNNDILIGTDGSTTTAASGSNNTLNLGNALYGTNLLNSTNSSGVALLGVNVVAPGADLEIGGAQSVNGPATSGYVLRVDGPTITDTSSAGTTAEVAASTVATPTFVGSAAKTYTQAETLLIAGPPTASTNITITTGYGLSVNGTGVVANFGSSGTGNPNYLGFNDNRAYIGYTGTATVVQGTSTRGVQLTVNNNVAGSGTQALFANGSAQTIVGLGSTVQNGAILSVNGTFSTNNTVFMTGTGTVTAGTNGAACFSSSGQLGANSANCIASLLHYKQDIEPILPDEAFKTVAALAQDAITYRYTDDYLGSAKEQRHARDRQEGFGAEYVERDSPQDAEYNSDGKLAGVRYEQTVASLVVAVDAERVQIEALRHANAVAQDPCQPFNAFGRWVMGCK